MTEERISRNFALGEWAVSDSYPNLAREISLTAEDRAKITPQVHGFLQPLRDEHNVPIYVLSGKRTEDLNYAVSGSQNSQHLFRGQDAATDFTPKYWPGPGLMKRSWVHLLRATPILADAWIDWYSLYRNHFGQLIAYEWSKEKNRPKILSFIHLGAVTENFKGEAFLCRSDGMYETGDIAAEIIEKIGEEAKRYILGN